MHPNGKFLIAATTRGVAVLEFDSATGSLRIVDEKPVTFPRNLYVAGEELLVKNEKGDIFVFGFGASGTLSLKSENKNAHTVGFPKRGGHFLYSAPGPLLNTVLFDPHSNSFVPTSGGSVPFGPVTQLEESSNGKVVAATDYGEGKVFIFNLDTQNGALSPVMGSPFKPEKVPGALAVDPLGEFVLFGDYFPWRSNRGWNLITQLIYTKRHFRGQPKEQLTEKAIPQIINNKKQA